MERIDTNDVLLRAAAEDGRQRCFISDDVVLVLGSGEIERRLFSMPEPFYFAEGRLLRIVEGRMRLRISLEDYELSAHDMLVIPPQVLMEPQWASDDLQTEALQQKALPGIPADMAEPLLPQGVQHLHLTDEQWQRQSAALSLIASLIGAGQREAVSHVIIAMLCDIRAISQQQQSTLHSKPSRGEETFHRFLRLANEHGYHERSIAYYATALNLTPNHLSAIVRQQSQRTVLDWLTERTLTEAKILLRHTDLMIYEIAEHLNFSEHSAFSLYFKKHTGMTPLEYREGD